MLLLTLIHIFSELVLFSEKHHTPSQKSEERSFDFHLLLGIKETKTGNDTMGG